MPVCIRLIVISLAWTFIVTSLIFYFVGYRAGQKWNGNSKKAECTIMGHDVIEDWENYACGNINGVTILCLDIVYVAYVDVIYTVNNTQYSNILRVNSYSSEINAFNKLNNSYPINGKIICYYDSNNPNISKLYLVNTSIYLIAFFIFLIMGIIIAIIPCICELE